MGKGNGLNDRRKGQYLNNIHIFAPIILPMPRPEAFSVWRICRDSSGSEVPTDANKAATRIEGTPKNRAILYRNPQADLSQK